MFKRRVDAVTTDVTVKKGSDFFSAQTFRGFIEGPSDAIQNGVAGGGVKDQRGASGAVVPDGERSLEMRQFDDRAAVESSVDGTQAKDLGFGAAGRGAEEAGTRLAQGRSRTSGRS